MRIRAYYASVAGKMWVSPGHATFSLLGFARMVVRAWLGSREPIPRMWVR